MRDKSIKRRDFIKLAGKASLLTAAFGAGEYIVSKNVYKTPDSTAGIFTGDRSVLSNSDYPDVVSIKSLDHSQAIIMAIGLIGGIDRFISTGDIVTLKPNIGWDRTSAQGANTNPVLLEAVAKLCFDAGASKVVITDVSCNDFRRSFRRSGIGELSKKIGAEIIFPEERHFVNADLKGEILGQWPVLRPFLETDKLINMPVVKHHSLSKITAGMKNWYGVLGGPRNRLHQQIDLSIADLADFFRPTLIIVDATRVLFRNGPAGGSLADVEIHDTVIAATDQIAADSYSCKYLNIDPNSLSFLTDGQSRGLGKIDGYSLIEKTDIL